MGRKVSVWDIKTQYEKTVKASMVYDNLKQTLDRWIEEYYGFHYSDRDMDYIIDTLDYSTGDCSFKKFHELMLKEKKKIEDKMVNKDGERDGGKRI